MIRADKRKYHYIYKTTCLITNRYYIGMHSTENLEDGYIGSGKRLWHSIKKHGKENHVCEILEFLPGRKELAAREAQLVNEELLDDDLCMNLNVGGNGGWHACNAVRTRESRHSCGNGGKIGGLKCKTLKLGPYAPENVKAQVEKRRENKTGWFDPLNIEKTVRAAQSDLAKAKRAETRIKNNFQQKENNSQWGVKRHMINKDGLIKKVLSEHLQEFIDSGWIKGGIKNNAGKTPR